MNTATITKRDLIDKGIDVLDLDKAGKMPVHHQPTGGVSHVDIAQVIELGKIMSASQLGAPPHLRGNVGACVRVVFQAVEWGMSPFSVADMSYIVNDRIAYQSQLLHAVIEARAPLQHRLDCEYEGDGADRTCTVRGMFRTGDVREYTSPRIKDIKVKNSPLWTADPDQQLFYYASRSWARKWCPDVLLGVYTKEELQSQPMLGQEDQIGPGLHARLSGSERSSEGHTDGHAARELAQIAGAGQTIEHEPPPSDQPPATEADAGATTDTKRKKKSTSDAPIRKWVKPEDATADVAPQPAAEPDNAADQSPPKTVRQYHRYASAWIKKCTDVEQLRRRWGDERALRNEIGMTSHERAPLDEMVAKRREELKQ